MLNKSRERRVLRMLTGAVVVTAASVATVQTASAVLPNVTNALNRLEGLKLFVNPDSPSRRQAQAWKQSRPAEAALMERIAAQPIAQWIGDWSNPRRDVAGIMAASARQRAVPVLVAYNIPHRDCGLYSAGGSASASGYKKWIREFAAGLSGNKAVVVLEPDALAGSECLSANQREERYALLRDAVQVLKAANALVYVDAGHARWLSPDEAAARLAKSGIALADGFSLNVSNYLSTAANVAYGNQVSSRTGGKRYIVDTSRNGVGGRNGEWCNVGGQALGSLPTTRTGHALADAFLWIKQPGESDGTCAGGPRAGQWWPEYALGLAQRQSVTLASAR